MSRKERTRSTFDQRVLASNAPTMRGPRHTGLPRWLRRGSFLGMSATLTIDLDADVLQSAEQEARARRTTLSEVVTQQLRVMARNWQDTRGGKTPITDALRGAVKLPSDFDEQTLLTGELEKEHGV